LQERIGDLSREWILSDTARERPRIVPIELA
jgi:hypothetical protein